VLGGGVVPGGVILVGGSPGIGKSTLLLQASEGIASNGFRCLYVTGEESLLQTKMRASRLGVLHANLLVMAETNLDAIMHVIASEEPTFLVVDSIQMVFKPDLPSAPGTVTQVRECATELTRLAKKNAMATVLVGHVTKQGSLAGPRILEHIVDTVLYFEGERFHEYRILRAVKNRHGSTNEIGIFEMTQNGLRGVENPSELFLANRGENRTGSVIVACMEGTRPLLVEIQALTARAAYGTPERRTSGIDRNRLSMLLAVLERRAGLKLFTQDVFVNVAGGVVLTEPAADLATALAVASSFLDRPIPPDVVAIGEVGLGAEIRGVTQLEPRLNEAERLGFQMALVPAVSVKSLKKGRAPRSIALRPIRKITEALQFLMEQPVLSSSEEIDRG